MIGIDSVDIRKLAPRARNMPASVTMKGGMSKTWMIAPIAAPKAAQSSEDRDEGDQRRHAAALDRERDEHGGEADHRADRQIDAAGDDDEGHAGRDDAEKGVVGEQIGDHAGRGEVGKLQRAERKAGDEDHGRDQRRAAGALMRCALRSRGTMPARPDSRGDCSSSTTSTTTALTTRLNSGG